MKERHPFAVATNRRLRFIAVRLNALHQFKFDQRLISWDDGGAFDTQFLRQFALRGLFVAGNG